MPNNTDIPPYFTPALACAARRIFLTKGEALFREGQQVTGIYYVISGEVKQTGGQWYVFDPSQDAPEMPLSGNELQVALDAAQTLVNQRRELPMSGAVYVDNRETPTFFKVFDPANMGSSCSCSTEPVMPRYIFSQIKPDSLPFAPPPAKPGLFSRLTGRK